MRDPGLLDSALARPRASAFGQDAYPTLPEKAASLLHSIARNHALIDGNKRLAWAATDAFCRLNAVKVAPPDDDSAIELVLRVATGELEVPEIAATLAGWMKDRDA